MGNERLGSFLFSFQPAVLVRRDMMIFFENLTEIAAGPKPGLQGDLQDTLVCVPQKLLGLLQPY